MPLVLRCSPAVEVVSACTVGDQAVLLQQECQVANDVLQTVNSHLAGSVAKWLDMHSETSNGRHATMSLEILH